MSTQMYLYPFDPTGLAETNKITNERHTILAPSMLDFFFIVPKCAPYFRRSMKVRHITTGRVLTEGIDFTCTHLFHEASHSIGQPIYGSITFYDHTLTGQVSLEYQTIGGDWTIDEATIARLLANYTTNPRVTTWEQVVSRPYQFPPINHEFDIDDFYGASDIVEVLRTIKGSIDQSGAAGLNTHIADINNPHQVTKAQVGLGLVMNYPIATQGEAQNATSNAVYMTPLRTKQAIEAIAIAALDVHRNDKSNPHEVTKVQVGLGNLENYPVATLEQARTGTSGSVYMTAERVKDAITAQVRTDFDAFVRRRDNPHVVTKTQVGLELLENYPVATKQQAEDGNSNTVYMTALRVKEAITAQFTTGINVHLDDRNNPHMVTKAQVGLGNVENFAIATEDEARSGTSSTAYMTPLRVRQAIDAMGGSVDSHIESRDNPHQVTKVQVGLGNVENYTVATQAEAESGSSNAVYMTPLRVKQAIAVLGGGMNAHASDTDNPHRVTAEQVGAYDKPAIDLRFVSIQSSINDLALNLAEKLGRSETAANSRLLDGKAENQLSVANADRLGGKSIGDIISEIGSSQSAVVIIRAYEETIDEPINYMELFRYQVRLIDSADSSYLYNYGTLSITVAGFEQMPATLSNKFELTFSFEMQADAVKVKDIYSSVDTNLLDPSVVPMYYIETDQDGNQEFVFGLKTAGNRKDGYVIAPAISLIYEPFVEPVNVVPDDAIAVNVAPPKAADSALLNGKTENQLDVANATRLDGHTYAELISVVDTAVQDLVSQSQLTSALEDKISQVQLDSAVEDLVDNAQLDSIVQSLTTIFTEALGQLNS